MNKEQSIQYSQFSFWSWIYNHDYPFFLLVAIETLWDYWDYYWDLLKRLQIVFKFLWQNNFKDHIIFTEIIEILSKSPKFRTIRVIVISGEKSNFTFKLSYYKITTFIRTTLQKSFIWINRSTSQIHQLINHIHTLSSLT